jgi:hypothetical protein
MENSFTRPESMKILVLVQTTLMAGPSDTLGSPWYPLPYAHVQVEGGRGGEGIFGPFRFVKPRFCTVQNLQKLSSIVLGWTKFQ